MKRPTILDELDARRDRAKSRIKSIEKKFGTSGNLYFAIQGIDCDAKEYVFKKDGKKLATLHVVIEPPNDIELSLCMRNPVFAGWLNLYTRMIKYELVIHNVRKDKKQAALDLYWAIISLIAVKTSSKIKCPAMSEQSWSVLSSIEDNSCYVMPIDDTPRISGSFEIQKINKKDLSWVEERIGTFYSLVGDAKFVTSLAAFNSYHHSSDYRLMIGALWSGIEALFDVDVELRHRIANYAAALIEPRGHARLTMYRNLVQLYGTRSKIVHGRSISQKKLHEHVSEVSAILAVLLQKTIEHKGIFSRAELDERVHAEG